MSDDYVPCECVECPCTYTAKADERVENEELLCDECSMGNHNDAD